MATKFDVLNSDCLDAMRSMPENSVDAVVTDPPYGLSFMGKDWDYGVPGKPFWTEALRVAKPGAYLLAFGGTRTYHRLACAIEDAGWEIRDCIMWTYGSGMPKSMDVSKAIDKAMAGEMRRAKLLYFVTNKGVDGDWLVEHGVADARSFADWTEEGHSPSDRNWSLIRDALGVTEEEEKAFERAIIGRGQSGASFVGYVRDSSGTYNITAPATPEAAEWNGWGTCLKPAWEPIIVARKPLDGTVAANVLKYGTGAINIDGCRVPTNNETVSNHSRSAEAAVSKGKYGDSTAQETHQTEGQKLGRFPANLIHDGSSEVLALFPESNGGAFPSHSNVPRTNKIYGRSGKVDNGSRREMDSGSAARFFYCAKASKADRGEGNDHPTVKPIALMKYLVKLVCRQGGTVLDPFCGSGSTGVACMEEGMDFIGCEKSPEYAEIARRRISERRDGNGNPDAEPEGERPARTVASVEKLPELSEILDGIEPLA